MAAFSTIQSEGSCRAQFDNLGGGQPTDGWRTPPAADGSAYGAPTVLGYIVPDVKDCESLS